MNDNLVMHNIDVYDFIKTLDSCTGDVFLETPEGDVLNLKSKLCQIAGLANIIQGAFIAEATIRCTNPEDEQKLFRFNLYKEVPGEEK
ncbi:MAG: hypothetical protein PUB05_04705 [Firmicutes bacterium]|nr:hypothetical protein [Bacillota bacterium]